VLGCGRTQRRPLPLGLLPPRPPHTSDEDDDEDDDKEDDEEDDPTPPWKKPRP
jgi:hypothetical protein